MSRRSARVDVAGPTGDWSVTFPADQVAVPGPGGVAGRPLWRRGGCAVDTASDADARLRRDRAWRKSGECLVLRGGTAAAPARCGFEHTCRLHGACLRVSTELTLARDALPSEGVWIGNVYLEPDFTAMATPGFAPDGRLLAPSWEPLPAPRGRAGTMRRWTDPVPFLLLQHRDGPVLEIGIGGDLWRWQAGVQAERNSGRFRLRQDRDGLWFERQVSHCSAEHPPVARPYRFLWHLAWQAAPLATAEPTATLPLPLAADGEVDPDRLRATRAANPDAALVLDLAALPWADTQRRAVGEHLGGPCFACDSVVSRLKRCIRQLAALPPAPVLVRGYEVARCEVGGHIARGGRALPHLDIWGWRDFLRWSRRCLGPERPLHVAAPPVGLPSALDDGADEPELREEKERA